MKKFALFFILAATVVWGIEVGGYVGFNSQTWQDDDGHTVSGTGGHAGILGGFGITPSCLPAYIGLESGVLFQNAAYKGEDFLIEGDDMEIHLNNLVIPILLKVNLKPSRGFHVGAGLGPSFIIHSSGNYEYNILIHFADDFQEENLATDLGFQLKGDVGIKLAPLLWLKPALTFQFNNKPDNPFDQDNREGDEFTLFLSLGLVLKP